MAMKLSLPAFSMPKFAFMSFSPASAGTALVIRAREVQLSVPDGRTLKTVRAPINGDGEEAIAQAIRQAMATGGVKTKRMAVSIAHTDVLIRSFTIPVIPKSEWETAVQFEARKYIPFKPESLAWDYHVLPASDAQAKRLEVVFAGIARETFTKLQAACAAAGIQPVLIEPMSVSLARLAAERSQGSTKRFSCLVDIEAEGAHILIARGGLPFLSRDVNFANGSESAEASNEPAADRRVQRLLSELHVSISFFSREYPAAAIGQIWLFGDEALISTWSQTLAGQMSCPVASGRELLSGESEQGLPLSCGSHAGVLRAQGAGSGPVLDFLKRAAPSVPDVSRPGGRTAAVPTSLAGVASLVRPAELAVFGVVAAMILSICWGLGAQAVTGAQRQLDQLTASHAPVGHGLDAMDKKALTPIMEKAKKDLKLLEQIMTGRVSVAAKLDGLARSLPDGVWLTGLTFDGKWDANGKNQVKLTVNGACYLGEGGKELSAIQEFESRVKQDQKVLKGLTTAQLGQINAQSGPREQPYTYRTFALNCQSGNKL